MARQASNQTLLSQNRLRSFQNDGFIQFFWKRFEHEKSENCPRFVNVKIKIFFTH